MPPSSNGGTAFIWGPKKKKEDRLTVLGCTNPHGTEEFPPFNVVNHAGLSASVAALKTSWVSIMRWRRNHG